MGDVPTRVAAVQLSGALFDRERSVEQICEAIADAAGRGLTLLVFPECFIGGYPYWRGNVSVRAETELGCRLYESAVGASGPEVEAIAGAAIQHGVAAVVGANEKDEVPGRATAYNSLLVFHPDDGFVGRHRKLVPTHTERAYWGRGGAEDVRTFDLPVGRVGGLICYEHHMLLARAALAAMGEEIHCAAWPGYWETGEHIADKKPGPASQHGEIDAVVRDYAMSSQNFVVSANAYIRDDDIPADLADVFKYNLARGGSAVVDPSGRYIAGPVLDQEAFVEAELDPRARRLAKSYIDTVGHYARPDIFTLEVASGSRAAERDQDGRRPAGSAAGRAGADAVGQPAAGRVGEGPPDDGVGRRQDSFDAPATT